LIVQITSHNDCADVNSAAILLLSGHTKYRLIYYVATIKTGGMTGRYGTLALGALAGGALILTIKDNDL